MIFCSDCSVDNLMMDADELFPNGFHPLMQHQLPDFSDFARQLPRRKARVRYLYVDYGISSYFSPKGTEARDVVGLDGRDRDVPELSADVPYDPFKVDVFLIGSMLKQEVYLVSVISCRYYNDVLPVPRNTTTLGSLNRSSTL